MGNASGDNRVTSFEGGSGRNAALQSYLSLVLLLITFFIIFVICFVLLFANRDNCDNHVMSFEGGSGRNAALQSCPSLHLLLITLVIFVLELVFVLQFSVIHNQIASLLFLKTTLENNKQIVCRLVDWYKIKTISNDQR